MFAASYAPIPTSDPDLPGDIRLEHLHADSPVASPIDDDDDDGRDQKSSQSRSITDGLTRFSSSYHGALILNFCAFLIPAVYDTLSKMWIANIDSSLVSTSDAYTYFSCIIDILNEGLPRAAWSTIGSGDTARDTAHELTHRLSLTYTLISVQSFLGFLLSLIFLVAAPQFVDTFVPGQRRATSVTYLRILAFDSLASTLNTAVSFGTRALDKPDVPLLMSTVQTLTQIVLELALVSTVRFKSFTPTIHTIATIEIVCDLAGAAAGLAYFVHLARRSTAHLDMNTRPLTWFSYPALKELFIPGRWTLTESAIRNAIYLWLISGVVSMGQTYATAWGVFNTIRWGLVMVPVLALEATSNAFVGHRWGIYQSEKHTRTSRASWSDVLFVMAPALRSVLITLLIESPLCMVLSFYGAASFARYLSNSDEVAAITAMMWRSIDWCYVCYGVSAQLATVLLAAKPRWYLYQSLIANIFYVLPWALALPHIELTPETAWAYHKWIFGGVLVFGLGILIVFDSFWAFRLRGGKTSIMLSSPRR